MALMGYVAYKYMNHDQSQAPEEKSTDMGLGADTLKVSRQKTSGMKEKPKTFIDAAADENRSLYKKEAFDRSGLI